MFKPMIDEDFDESWERRGDESEFQYTLRLLESYQFHFKDLGLEKEESWLAMSRIREELAGALDAYAKKLPPAESLTLRILGKPALNLFTYQPPQAIIYGVAGKGAEAGLSLAGRYAPARWIRFNFALPMKGLYELLSPAADAFTIAPVVGFELENTAWSNMLLQARLGVRVGYQFSTADGFLSSDCDVQRFRGDSRMCSAPLAQLFLAFVFYERIRLQGGVEWFPYFLPPMRESSRNIWNGFIEIGWQWISPF